MARGQKAKEEIISKILETFSGSFKYDKEIRIPIQEDGELIQIKVTLTAAKVNVKAGNDTTIPNINNIQPGAAPVFEEITEQEKIEVQNLMEELNF